MANFMKKKGALPWVITSATLVTLFAVATGVCVSPLLSGVLDFALGGPTNIYAPGSEGSFSAKYNNKTESLQNANEVNQELCKEGFILLKNKDNALPIATPNSPTPSKSKPKVTVFGKNSVNMAIGGSGSGAASGKSKTIHESLEDAGYEVNPVVTSFYEDKKASGPERESNSTNLDSGDTVVLSTGETPQSKYTSTVKDSYSNYSDAAIVVITRIGGEGFDLPRSMKGANGYINEDDHFLQLDKNETDLIKAVCESNFKHVIVVLNSGSPMELAFLEDPNYYAYQDKIDGAIWMGYPGNTGVMALGKILNGEVNPSGRTVDTFATHFKDNPTWNNFGDNLITGDNSKGIQGGDQYKLNGENTLYYFVDYEESVYVGYRYYETRGETDGEAWYKDNVVYPFGYGLSYTSFEWNIKNKTSIPSSFTEKSTISIEVEVTNTGDVAGKDVVEIYASAPYTSNGIEKPSETLVAYAKTDLIEPGKKDTVTLEVNPYYIASYDYKDANNNGFKGFELEKGEYTLRVSKNAHSVVDEVKLNLANDIKIENDPTTDHIVENLYTDQVDRAFNSDTQLSTLLSRTNWTSTWPTSPSTEEKNASQELINQFKDVKTNNPIDYDAEEYPMTDASNGMVMRDLLYDEEGNFVGNVDYDDPRWDTLLDQMKFDEVANMYNYASYGIKNVDSVGLPNVQCADGPVGWTSFVNKNAFQNCCSYCCGVIVAATWNDELVEKFGEAVGEEGLVGNDGTPYTGFYAPGMNIHRSPFGGRNFEYFSEDALLTGKIAAAEVRGLQSRGTIPFIKHFALNEQETHRSITGDASWVTEQAMREIYLRAFEICVKEGNPKGLMSSFNRIGTRWTGGDYRLLTTILRDEWGFKGSVICDFNTIPDYMNSRQMAYAGGDLNLATQPVAFADESSTGDVCVMRRVLHNVLYTIVNSNTMKGEVIGKHMAKWRVMLIGVDSAVAGIVVVWGILVFVLDSKRNKTLKEETQK